MNNVSAEKLAKLQEKIALLLNKAENTPYPAEAQTFQEHAERLMVRYGITAAQVDAAAGNLNGKTEKIIEVEFEFKGSFRKAEFMGFASIVRAWPGISLLKQNRTNSIMGYVIGHETDVESVLRMLRSLLIQGSVARTNWWKSVRADKAYLTHNEKHVERRTYTIAWYSAVAHRIKNLFREETAEAGSGTELVLANRQTQVDDWVANTYTNLRTSRSSLRTGSYGASTAGQRDGQRADLGLGGKIAESSRAQLS